MLKKSSSNEDYNEQSKSDGRLSLNLTKKMLTGRTHDLDSLLGFAEWYVSSFYSIIFKLLNSRLVWGKARHTHINRLKFQLQGKQSMKRRFDRETETQSQKKNHLRLNFQQKMVDRVSQALERGNVGFVLFVIMWYLF